MTTAELLRANGLADELISKLERIKILWAEVVSEDELIDLSNVAGSIAGSLEQAREAYNSDDFPTVDDLNEIAHPAEMIGTGLMQATGAWNSDDFPTVDDLGEIATQADSIAANLKEAADGNANMGE